MKNLILFIGGLLFLTSCNSKEEVQLLNFGDIDGALIRVGFYPTNQTKGIDVLYLNPHIFEESDSSFINVYGKLSSGAYIFIDKCNVPRMIWFDNVTALYKNGFIKYQSILEDSNLNKSTKEKIEFKFLGDSLVIVDRSVTTENIKNINPKDSLALLSLYKATNGKNWTNSWDLSAPINTWFGVKLGESKDEFVVAGLKLTHNNLKGTLPKKFVKQIPIRSCELIGNQIQATIETRVNVYDDYFKPLKIDIGFNEIENPIHENGMALVFYQATTFFHLDSVYNAYGQTSILPGDTVYTIGKLEMFSYAKKKEKVDGFEGNYTPVRYKNDTVLIFSGHLSFLPQYITPENLISFISLESGSPENEVEMSSESTLEYPNRIIVSSSHGWESFHSEIRLDEVNFTFQEALVYANASFRNIFNTYLGDEVLEGIIDESIEEVGYIRKGIERDENGDINKIYVYIEEGCVDMYEVFVKEGQIIIKNEGGC